MDILIALITSSLGTSTCGSIVLGSWDVYITLFPSFVHDVGSNCCVKEIPIFELIDRKTFTSVSWDFKNWEKALVLPPIAALRLFFTSELFSLINY